ncbi:TonB family protein [Shewanella sp. NKUCC05_KAH]|uniref:energy transducer TonB n=1 Tax=Shewanella sp. NKUCC05_KAH TaxID=2842126 RepID=UPI001C5B9758|nr:TonB family protein [Shewanella sp. NKUCC05_KAH]
MTPKRYLAFGALTVAIQTGVIASQPAMTMQPSAQSSSVNQASLTPSANTVTLNFSTATSAASNTNAEPIKQTDAKVATVNSTVQKNSTAQNVSTAESVNKAVIPKTKADQRIDSQLAKKSSATKPTANNHPNTDPLATNALEPSALNPSVLAHKRLEQIEHQTEPKTAQMDLITNAAEVDAKATPNVASETADSAQTNIVELAKPLFAAAPPQPTYPKIARKKGLEGTATIEVMFNELGEQLALTLVKSSGFSLLDQAALDAVENWQFAAPAQRLASHYKVRVPIRFALN